ncbi:MAG: caspase family protein [Candidatus Competibacter sp.]
MGNFLSKGMALALLALLGLVELAQATERVALVIGNGGYQHANVLANTGNDAQAVADALRKLGFTLDGGQPYRDLSRTQLEQVLKAFGPRARDAEAVVVYYAGHGVESGGANYLVPVDAELQHEVHLPLETVALDTVLEQIAGPRGWRLVILDACRNNPLAARMVRGAGGRGVTRGLARVEPQGQTYIAYAARGGTEALDQDPAGSDHSPFAAVLLDYLSQPLPLERLFGAVREDVLKRTGGQQEPWLYGAFGRDPIYLTGGDNREQETLFWNRVKDSRNPAVFRVYLRHFPGGVFADQARVRLAKLGGAEPPPPSDRELAFWHSVKDSPNPADFRAYLDQYPEGAFAKLAQNWLAELEEAARRELAFWNSVKDSRNPADFRVYLDQYPSGTFVKLAQNRLAELEEAARKAERQAEEERRRQAEEERRRQAEEERRKREAAERAAISIVRRYFEYATNHQIDEAINCLKELTEKTRPRLENVEWFRVEEVRLENITADEAQVWITLQGKAKDSKPERYKGTIPLYWNGSDWRIITLSNLVKQ